MIKCQDDYTSLFMCVYTHITIQAHATLGPSDSDCQSQKMEEELINVFVVQNFNQN